MEELPEIPETRRPDEKILPFDKASHVIVHNLMRK